MTPVRLRRVAEGELRHVRTAAGLMGGPEGGQGLRIFEGAAWRPLTARSNAHGPLTSVSPSEFESFLAHPARLSTVGPLLSHSPLVASRPHPSGTIVPERGRPLPEGGVVVAEERGRTEALLRGFLSVRILVSDIRIYQRVFPMAALRSGAPYPVLAPGHGDHHALVIPPEMASVAASCAFGRRMTVADAKTLSGLLPDTDDPNGGLVESVNALARCADSVMTRCRRERRWLPGREDATKAALADADGAWAARAGMGGILRDEGEGVVAILRGLVDALTVGYDDRGGHELSVARLALLVAGAEAGLVPLLRHGTAPSETDAEALACL